jgi:sensor histidine kinase YesM
MYSLKKRLLFILCVIFSSFLIVIAGIDVYFTSVLRRDIYKAVKDTLGVYNRELSGQLRALEIYLFEINGNNVDISLLGNDRDDTYTELIHIKTLLTNSLPSFSEINGLFVYSASSGYFVTKYASVGDYSSAYYIRSMLNGAQNSGTLSEINTRSWFVRKVDAGYHFIRIIRTGDSYIGAWADAENLTSPFRSISGYKADVFFTDGGGRPLVEAEGVPEKYDPQAIGKKYSVLRRQDGIKYVSAAERMDFGDCWLLAFIPLADIDRQLLSVGALVIVLTLVIIILTPFIIFLLNRLWTVPLVRLRAIAETLHAGAFDVRIPTENVRYTEIMEVYDTFNEMIDEIRKLQIRIYEERIAKSEFELQYLKSQLAPHFLINCLTTISALAVNTENEAVIQNMVSCLTNHLRYTLSGKTYVSLSEELHYIENYIALARLRAPGSLEYTEEIDPAVTNAKVFPLILLMLTENTLKYNLIAEEKLRIKITASMVNSGGVQFVHLVHLDSGDGFSAGSIELFSQVKNGTAADSGHVGLYNTLKRLELAYDGKASIDLSNEPGWGARIDIMLPYGAFEPPALPGKDS